MWYFGETAYWSDEAHEYMQSNPDIDTALLLRFIEHLCPHDSHFSDDKVLDWNMFEAAEC